MNPLPRLYRAYRFLHPRHRHIVRIAVESERFRMVATQWSTPQKEAWINRRLRATLSAAADTPFYRERFATIGIDPRTITPSDFARIPPLDRREIADHADTIRLLDAAAPGVVRDSTGGSTGVPTTIWKGPEERGWAEGAMAYTLHRFGLPLGARTALLWGHHLDARLRATWMDRLRDLRDNLRWFDAFRLSEDVLSEHHRQLDGYRPQVVVAYAGALYELARFVSRCPGTPKYPELAFVTGAEKLHAHERALIEQVFQRPVFERYGSRDAGLIAFQSNREPRHGLEVDWANVLVEPETDEPESNLLVTKLHADAFPMIRYRIGDRARFLRGARPGHPVFHLEEVLGREVERVRLVPGRWLSGTNFPHLFKDFPITDYQVYQAADGAIEIRLVPRGGGALEGAIRATLEHTLAEMLSPAQWTIRIVERIERTRANKRRPVVSELAQRDD